jgi:phosphoglycolate phosphatase/putative hydrolase of the HAD superfamily
MRPGAGDSIKMAATAQADVASKLSGLPADLIRACAARWMDREPLDAVAKARLPGVAEFFSWANEIGLPVAAASDYDPREKLRALGLNGRLKAVVWAQQAEVGAFKPDARVLLAAARRLGVMPEEALYVGDREDVDGAAARAAGMQALVLGAGRGWREVKRSVEAAIASGAAEIPVDAAARI